MNILLLGSGGREHALAWKMAASPLTDRLICAPGNAGIAREAECVALDIGDHAAVIAYCRQNSIDLVVVGPEAPLCAGIVDDLEAAGTKAFGPSRAAARLEGSKGFTKDLCRTHGIPTATYERFRAAAPIVDAATSARVMETIVLPTLRAMKAMGAPYKGVLFAGLMLTAAGPQLMEYNVRFGDPECQVLMLRLMSDLVPALLASRDGVLKSLDLRWFPQAALTVVMAAKGYPGPYAKGSVIEGLDEAAAIEGVEIFHAGTKAESGRIVANGGRVLNIAALGQTVREAQARAYEAISRIRWPEGFCRHDIGWRAVEREKQPSEQSQGSAARLSK
jgi:phosphoribosylamine-glycine ligase